MAPSFSLADILAIVIPLGVVCLASLLILGIVLFRLISLYKTTKELEDQDKSNLTVEQEDNQAQKHLYKRSCLDIICCIPSSAYRPPRIKQSATPYSPKIGNTEYDFGIPESQRRLSDASKNQSLRAKQLQNKSKKDVRESSEPAKEPSVSTNVAKETHLAKFKNNGNPPMGTPVERMEFFKVDGLKNNDTRHNYAYNTFDSNTPTPESVLSLPKSMSIHGPNVDFFKQQESNDKARYPHPYAQGARQPPTPDSNTSSMANIPRSLDTPDMGSFVPLPIPPGIKGAYNGISSSPSRTSGVEYSTKDPGVQKFPSFASKLRTLTPNGQTQDFTYPAKSELRNKHSWKKGDLKIDDNASNREYFSASNSLSSNNPEDSPLSAKFNTHKSEFIQKTTPPRGRPSGQNGLRTEPNYTDKQHNSVISKYQAISELPLKFSPIMEKRELKESHIPVTHQTTEKTTPPLPPPSRESQRNKINTNDELYFSEKSEPSAKALAESGPNNNKNSATDPASLSNNSVVDPEKLMQVLQQNEQIIEGRERSDVIKVTRGHSAAPSYSGYVVQPHSSEAQFLRYPSDMLRSYQLSENIDARGSYSSGSKQSTPIDKMSNYNPLSTDLSHTIVPTSNIHFHPKSTSSAAIRPYTSRQSDNPQSHTIPVSDYYSTSHPGTSNNNYTLPTSSVPPVPSKAPPVPTKVPPNENPRTPDPAVDIEGVKEFSKSSIQLSSPLGSPHSSYVPSRHSSLSTKSLGRSRSLLTERPSKHLKKKLPDDDDDVIFDYGKQHEELEGYKAKNDEIKFKGELTDYDTDNTSRHHGTDERKAYGMNTKDLSISTPAHRYEHNHGTISAIAALNPPASPRSPGYEPSKGALITSTPPLQQSDRSELQTSSQRPAVKKHLDDQHKLARDAQLKKKAAMKSRLNKPLPSTPIILEDGVVSHLHGAKFLVIASYKSRLSDEIDLEVGDVIKVNEVFDDNWCRARIVQSSVSTTNRNIRGVCPKACLSSDPI